MLPKGLLKEYSRTLSVMMRSMDMLIMFITGILAYVIRFHYAMPSSLYFLAIFTLTLAAPVVFSFFNIYISVRGKGLISHFITLFQAVCVLILLAAGFAFFTKTGMLFSRLWFTIWMIIACLSLIFFRCFILLSLRFMRSRGLNERRVVILGAGALGSKLAETVQQALWTGFRLVQFLDDHANLKPGFIQNISVAQTPNDLGHYLMTEGIDEIWLALPLRAEARVKAILYELRHHTINTRFVLDIFGMDLLHHSIADIAGFPVLNIRSTPMMGFNRVIKAVEDRMLAILFLMLVSPIFLLVALGVKCSSNGSILFKQYRHGWDGRIIKVYKFRTMKAHQEADEWITQATIDDARITAFGKFLRRTSLDELPQLINVLQGRMSIVGPRPHALAHNEFYKDAIHIYMQRHRVKPGITGWAQINGWRGETDTLDKMQKRVEYDLFYINNWSLGFDLKIIFLTLFRGFLDRNAY